MSLSKVLFVAGFFIGSAVVVLAMAAYESYRLNRTAAGKLDAEELAAALKAMGEPRLTVVWRENHFMQCSLTGRIEWVDEDRLLIDDGNDFYVMVDRSDIEAMF
jgi:hypothetical protein